MQSKKPKKQTVTEKLIAVTKERDQLQGRVTKLERQVTSWAIRHGTPTDVTRKSDGVRVVAPEYAILLDRMEALEKRVVVIELQTDSGDKLSDLIDENNWLHDEVNRLISVLEKAD